MSPAPTPGQTVGPFFGYTLPFPGGPDLVPPDHPGAVRVHGRVLDGHGDAVPDAILEIWQAGADGRVLPRPGSLARDGWVFTGWGRAGTDNAGGYSFTTLRPGSPAPGRRPFIALTVFARGLLNHLSTRIYLPDVGAGDDALLALLPDERRRRLIAEEDTGGLRFDVILQGAGETPFLTFGGDDDGSPR